MVEGYSTLPTLPDSRSTLKKTGQFSQLVGAFQRWCCLTALALSLRIIKLLVVFRFRMESLATRWG